MEQVPSVETRFFHCSRRNGPARDVDEVPADIRVGGRSRIEGVDDMRSIGNRTGAALLAVAVVSTSCGGGSDDPPASGATAGPAITLVEFGDAEGVGGTVGITNVGSDPVPMEDLQLCDWDRCVGLPPERLQPGVTLLVSSNLDRGEEAPDEVMVLDPGMGGFAPDGGEFSLHDAVDTGDPDGIVSYVAWGSGPHRYAPIATAAGLWVESAAVDAMDADRISAPAGAIAPSGWTASS